MDDLYKEYVISYFDRMLQLHGDRPEALRYSAKGQLLRFEALLDIDTEIRGKKVLDYGCGKGDFYQFLKDRNIPVSYTGLDINEKLIGIAERKFPECKFKVFDIEKDILKEDFDYIFLCAVFNLNIERLDDTIQNVLKKLFDHCRTALAFNALSAHDPNKDFQLHYVYPEDLLEFALKNLSPYAALKQGRIPYDFTVFVNRKQMHGMNRKEESNA
ncbi:MAG: class I SAM-dependent methyltransferase [Nitrospirae bacterium]|nr:class I SAM-dependent methyltransferase [Nitrospirota bacterium]